jgi:hypothetical protein
MRLSHESCYIEQTRTIVTSLPNDGITSISEITATEPIASYDVDAHLDEYIPTAEVDNDALASKHIASSSLKLREIDKISGSACENIRKNVASMLCTNRETLRDKIVGTGRITSYLQCCKRCYVITIRKKL